MRKTEFSRFIAARIGDKNSKSFTALIVRFAVAGIALSLAVMLLAVGIVIGFKLEVKQKIIGYSGHIQVKNLDLNYSKEARLIPYDSILQAKLNRLPQVAYVQPFTNKAGIVQSKTEIEGLLFKGVPKAFNWTFFEKAIKRGERLNNNDGEDDRVMISEQTALRLKADTGDRLDVFFIQNGTVRRRRPLICGIFNTGLAEFDAGVALTDMRTLQRIYTTGYDSITGYEVFLKDFNTMDDATVLVNNLLPVQLRATNVKQTNHVIFDWLEIIDTNAEVIILLMIIVAIINMCTALLILIVERTNMIGILKALGASNTQVRAVFRQKGFQLLVKGLIAGNILGLAAGYILITIKPIKLDEGIYYMDAVPFAYDWLWVAGLNAGTILICVLIIFIPAVLVNYITPVRAIRFS